MMSIFAIDLQLPLGVAAGVPYVAVIIVSLWAHNRKVVLTLSVACTLLIVLGYYLSPPGGEFWKVMANRSLAIFAVWSTAILVMMWESTQEKIRKIELAREKEKREIYIATIHGAQHILNNLLNELTLVKLEVKRHPDFDKEISDMFDEMLAESDVLIKKLSSVSKIDQEDISQSVHPK